MKFTDLKTGLAKISDAEFEEILEHQRTLLRSGDIDTIASMQEGAIQQIVLRLASLLPDDPLVKLCVRVMNQDLEAMITLSDAGLKNFRRGSR